MSRFRELSDLLQKISEEAAAKKIPQEEILMIMGLTGMLPAIGLNLDNRRPPFVDEDEKK